ncbi:ABC transporter permease [Phycisphaeraceae bacterium D3-23]
MNQTLALLLDAYRELNAKKLFWITLILSGVLCLIVLLIGRKGDSYQVLWFSGMSFGAGSSPEEFYVQNLFYIFGYKAWLTFGAGIIALVSTVGIFPEFIKDGSIDLVLSKPISRLRLFLMKWVSGLLFVFLQITVFTTACFLAIGFRGGVWAFSIFWAIPLTVLFFSYLYSFAVLIGVLTRSTIAALILTMLLWAPIILVDFVERNMLLPMVVQLEYNEAILDRDRIAAYSQIDQRIDPATMQFEKMPEINEALVQKDLDSLERVGGGWSGVQRWVYIVKTVLPKTGETTSYLTRFMYPEEFEADYLEDMEAGTVYGYGYEFDPELALEVKNKVENNRGPFWALGTSLLFELVCLSLAAWKFCRRDY